MTQDAPLTPAQQRVVDEIRRIAAQLRVDRLPQSEFDKHHRNAGVTTAGYQFGSWNEAVAAAGLEPIPSGASNVRLKISDEELLLDLVRVQAKLGGAAPSERKLARHGNYSPKPYKERWGSVAKAIAVAQARFAREARPGGAEG
jgi:hypothetical protein